MTLLGWRVGLGRLVSVKHKKKRPSIYRNLQLGLVTINIQHKALTDTKNALSLSDIPIT